MLTDVFTVNESQDNVAYGCCDCFGMCSCYFS